MLSGRKLLCTAHPSWVGKFLHSSLVRSHNLCICKQFIHKVRARGYLFYILDYFSVQLCFVAHVVPALFTGLFQLAFCLLEVSPALRFLNAPLLSGTTRCSRLILCISCPRSRVNFNGDLVYWRITWYSEIRDLGVFVAGEVSVSRSSCNNFAASWLTIKWGPEM